MHAITRRLYLAFAAPVLIAATASSGVAAPKVATAAARPPIILVQGWWEREHRGEGARERYWRLPPDRVARYNELQAEINELRARRDEIDRRIRYAIREQHRLLGYRGY